MHADADETTRELVHDDQHPVAPEHNRLASKEVDAPEAVRGVADERQPRGSGSIPAGDTAIVFRQDAVHDVPVDVDPKRLRNDPRDPRTAELRIARLERQMAWTSASSGPFGPDFFGQAVDENSRWYLRCTRA